MDNTVIDSAFAFTTLLPSVERQCPHCLLVTTFLFSRNGSYSSDASVISKMCASRIRTRDCLSRVRRSAGLSIPDTDCMSCSEFILHCAHFIALSFHYSGQPMELVPKLALCPFNGGSQRCINLQQDLDRGQRFRLNL